MAIILILFVAQDDPAAAVEALRSEAVEARTAATLKLKALGARALPALDQAAQDKDSEVAARAAHLARVIRTMQLLTPNLLKRTPGLEERLAKGDAHEWTRALLGAPADLEKADLEALVVRAFQGAKTVDERTDLCRIVKDRKLSVAGPEVAKLFDIRDRSDFRYRGGRYSPVRHLHQVALEALAESNHRESAAAVAELLVRDDAETAGAAVDLLVSWKATGVLPRVLTMMDQEEIEPSRALSLLRGLDAQDAAPRVLRLLRDDKADDEAAELLADWRAVHLSPDLIKLLKHRDERVRARAMELLAEFRCREAVPLLLERLRTDPPAGSHRIIRTLRDLNSREAAPDLLNLLKEADPGDSSLQSAVFEALGAMGDRSAIPIVMRIFAEGVPRDFAPARYLEEVKAIETTPEFLKLLRDAWPKRRGWALTALSMIGSVESIPSIAASLADPEPEVRTAAFRALAVIDAQAEVPRIEAFLKDELPWMRRAAVDSLRDLRATDSWRVLAPVLSDPNPDVATAAARALGRIGATEAIPALAKALTHADPGARVPAAGALTRLGSRDGVRVLLEADPAKYADLTAMNALRSPELWKRLQDTRLDRDLEGTHRKVTQELARLSGLAIEIKGTLGFTRISSDRGRTSLLEALEMLGGSSMFLLEPGRVRAGGGSQAYWKDWWAKEGGR